MTKLILIRGLPGSGKSTLAQSILDDSDGYMGHVEADMYFLDENHEYKFDQSRIGAAHAWCQRNTELSLQLGSSIIVSNTFITIKELRPYFEIALKYGILPSVTLCQGEFGNIHSVPQEALDRMKTRFCTDISPLVAEYEQKLACLVL